MNLVSTLAVLKNGLEYPMLWRLWIKKHQENDKRTKIDLAKQMLSEIRQMNTARLWIAMDRWFSARIPALAYGSGFDWVLKPNVIPYCLGKFYDPVLQKNITSS